MNSPSDRSGTALGPYRLIRLIGRGGMGEVYEAEDTVKERTVALKLLPTHLADDPDFRARFLRESQTVARLNDPHVIPIHDFGEIDGLLFLDMRIVHGTDLRGVIDQGRLSPARAVGIISQIAGALDSAHAAGLAHRDVKPENILLADNDFAYLVDFGIAQSVRATRMTATGSAIGSFAYMAPERFGDGPLTPASDVYSLACVLFEALTGAPPHSSTSIEKVISGHLMRPVPPTGTVLDPVIADGTAKDPQQRYARAGAFAAAARDALTSGRAQTLVAPVPPATPLTPATPVAPPTQYAAYPPSLSHQQPYQPPRPTNSNRTALIAALVTVITVLAGGGALWFALRDSGGDDPAAAPPSTPLSTTAITTTVTKSVEPAQQETPLTQPSAPSQPPSTDTRGTGDLGLATPISTPACNGQTVVFVFSATTPGSYGPDVANALSRYPGSEYLRTNLSCSSLRQYQNGNDIYAVYYATSSTADACAQKARLGIGTYARRLDNSTPVGTEICP